MFGDPPVYVSSYPLPGLFIVIDSTWPFGYPSLSVPITAKADALAPHPAGSTIWTKGADV